MNGNWDSVAWEQEACRMKVARLVLEGALAYRDTSLSVADETLRALLGQIRDERLELGTALQRLVCSQAARRSPNRPPPPRNPDEELALLVIREREDDHLLEQLEPTLRSERDPALRSLFQALRSSIADARARMANASLLLRAARAALSPRSTTSSRPRVQRVGRMQECFALEGELAQ